MIRCTAILAVASCTAAPTASGPRTVQPGAPGEPSREVAAGQPVGQPRHTAADVAFVRAMIAHHEQALAMTELVPGRSQREDVRLLALRIELSQQDEIALMRQWLAARDEAGATPSHTEHGAAGHDGARIFGMLTEQELARLAAAAGAEFDRLFLQFMIRHHEGALAMVADLFANAGAGQESEVFQLASEIDSDQRIEIARMRRMVYPGG
ncbi:MAG: DUF305 domain-containing protein [Longimicrobiales bacterium]